MNQPAYAGIAGLSVRALKPTGLQAGGCLVNHLRFLFKLLKNYLIPLTLRAPRTLFLKGHPDQRVLR